MKASDLRKLLEGIPDDAELVIGAPDSGQFWNPVPSQERAFASWKVPADWAESRIRHVNVYALINLARQPGQEDAKPASCPADVRALCL